jgi:hypothetical protein
MKEDYEISLIGPDGIVEFEADSHEEAMELIDDLTSACEGQFVDVSIETPDV